MVRKGRRFECGICRIEVWVCTSCDHRRKYCSPACSREGRRKSNRRAEKRFRAKEAGRLGNARRQRELYWRRKLSVKKNEENLTHHYSPGPPAPAILPVEKTVESPSAPQMAEPLEPRPLHSMPLTVTVEDPATAMEVEQPDLYRLPRCHFCGCPCCEDPSALDVGGS